MKQFTAAFALCLTCLMGDPCPTDEPPPKVESALPHVESPLPPLHSLRGTRPAWLRSIPPRVQVRWLLDITIPDGTPGKKPVYAPAGNLREYLRDSP